MIEENSVRKEEVQDGDNQATSTEEANDEPQPEKPKKKSKRRRFFHLILWSIVGLIGILIILTIIPTMCYSLESKSDPATSFAEAEGMMKDLIEDEEGRVCDQCHSQFLTDEEKTDTVYVLIHGVTNSPRTWIEFGEKLYADGSNVIIPLIPDHGMKDLEVNNLKNLKPEELREYADNVVDIAQGMGDEVVIIGLSGGGTVAAWIAQNRSDVDTVMLVAPLFGISKLPPIVDNMYINLFSKIPNINIVSSSEPVRDHVYRGESTQGLVSFLRFGKSINAQSEVNPSSVKNIILVTNAADKDVNNAVAKEIVSRWESGGAEITTFEFEKSLDLPHDIIDISEVEDAPKTIYPQLFDLLDQRGEKEVKQSS